MFQLLKKKIQFIKEKCRGITCCLPFMMPKLVQIYCVYFAVGCVNNHISALSQDHSSARQRFSGRKLDMIKDLRFEFGAFCHASVPKTSNTMAPRTEACLCLLSSMNSTGSVKMFDLNSFAIVTRDHFTVLPMPNSVISVLNNLSKTEGRKNAVRFFGGPEIIIDIDGRNNLPDMIIPADQDIIMQPAIVDQQLPYNAAEVIGGGDNVIAGALDANAALGADAIDLETIGTTSGGVIEDAVGGVIGGALDEIVAADRITTEDPLIEPILHISVKAALRDYPIAAKHAISLELQQMLDKKVWTPVHMRDLSSDQRCSVIRSSMFLKEKYLPNGEFEKLKARLVASGDQQDKSLYSNLSAATAATCSVFIIAAIAARERRSTAVVDITGAYLNANMSTEVIVHMKIDHTLTDLLIGLDETYKSYLGRDGGCTVRLDKALYGCVESAALWGEHIKGTLLNNGFKQNPREVCCYNKQYSSGPLCTQLTVIIHVDDLLITCTEIIFIEEFTSLLRDIYKDIKVLSGKVLGYLGLVFDFSTAGSVSVTAPGFMKQLLSSCKSPGNAVSPATEHLFNVRPLGSLPSLSSEDAAYFHSKVASLLYIGKRIHPEILTAVAFLTTRITVCDSDDLSKLARVLSYLNSNADRGITLCIGDKDAGEGDMVVRAHIDASYGVHGDGKSHTGCIVTVGNSGASYFRSAKQKIVTKSSTEAELVALSDSANVPIHIARFLRAQGYVVPPVILYQDNKSAMALISRGYSTSDLTKHISLRYFWVTEKVKDRTAVIVYCPTGDMHSNSLTKPVQGKQFIKERAGMTGWM